MNIFNRKRLKLSSQKTISLLFFPVLYPTLVCWLRWVRKYRIKDLKSVRKQFKQIKQNHPGGLLVCPNHLTYIDSIILIWAFATPWSYFSNYRTMCWNLPKASNVQESWLYRSICYLGKCLLIPDDLQQAQATMEDASYLLNTGQYVMVFPEGTRSHTGRINTENYVYGVGKLHADSPQSELLCVYLRGDKQQKASKMPKKSEQFSIQLKLVSISTELSGRRAMRDVATQMIDHLSRMETAYMDSQ